MPREFKDDFNLFLKNGAVWIAIGVTALIIIAVVYFLCVSGKKEK